MGQNDENTERGFLRRLRGGLAKTRTQLAAGLGNLFLGKKAIDDDVLADLETSLLRADVGVEATQRIMDALAQRVKRKQLADTVALFDALRAELVEQLRPIARRLVIDPAKRPFVILVVGVNGAGKTTTIGKLGQRLKSEGKSVLLAAGDTFRAAAVEQLTRLGRPQRHSGSRAATGFRQRVGGVRRGAVGAGAWR